MIICVTKYLASEPAPPSAALDVTQTPQVFNCLFPVYFPDAA